MQTSNQSLLSTIGLAALLIALGLLATPVQAQSSSRGHHLSRSHHPLRMHTAYHSPRHDIRYHRPTIHRPYAYGHRAALRHSHYRRIIPNPYHYQRAHSRHYNAMHYRYSSRHYYGSHRMHRLRR